jgi:FkbM family methyltransferase
MLKVEIEPNVFFEIPDNLQKIYTNFEPYTRKFIAEHLKPGEVFVDIGANFGFFSLLAAGLVGEPGGKVFAIEASPQVFPTLVSNTRAFGNIHNINSAAGDHAGVTDFYMTPDFVNSGVALSPFLQTAEKISIPIARLDDLLRQSPDFDGRVDFIKCDVQGDEVAVLNGARETIDANPGLRLIIEWAPAWMNNAGYDAQALPQFLRELGFREITVVDDYRQKPMTLAEMEDEFRNDTTGRRFCNLFAVR